jgi:hypothetical protein
MFHKNPKYLTARLVLTLTLLVGMFGMTPVSPAHAATILVTNTNASGPGSLASAISNANIADTTVTFDLALAGQTIIFACGGQRGK